ncbi:hypothetical protein [Streptomyces milbemycinicus]|uniref:hypothetical protein n=1 Tax=Streptomyces milbemycinicus TaxID=476552 RepID=UPI000A3B552F|nr:hypothetical protein [Streptomyces milbemycinicus]
MSGTGAALSLDCPSDIATECWKIPGYRYVSYDNSGDTPCGMSRINGAPAGVCTTPNVRVTSWVINGRNVLAAPTVDGWDNCTIPWLNDFATTLNMWDPFAGSWSVVQSEECAYFVRSRALPPTGVQYGRLTATNTDTNETLTFDPIVVSVPDTYYRRIMERACDGSTSVRWTDASGAVVAAPPMEQVIQCDVDVLPGAHSVPTQRLRPRVKRYTGSVASENFDDAFNVQTLTLRVITGPVRIRAAGSGSPVTYADDVTVPTGTVLTWGVENSEHAQLDGALIFNGTAGTSDFLINWTETTHTDSD